MARNALRVLDQHEVEAVERWTEVLEPLHASQEPARVTYTKRNGKAGSATGPVSEIFGEQSKTAVTIFDESKGRPTTINVYNITGIYSLVPA